MSILNILVRSTTRAEIFVDTFGRDVDLTNGRHLTKLFALPHLQAVIGGRGLAHTILSIGAVAAQAASLEALCDGIPGAMAWANAERRKLPEGASPALDEQEAGTSIALVAWDGSRVFCKLWNAYNSRDPAHSIVDLDKTRSRSYFGPGGDDPSLTVDSTSAGDAQMIALARRQVAYVRERLGPDAPIGGRLIGATLDRGRISMRTLADLETTDVSREPAAQSVETIFTAAAVVPGLGGAVASRYMTT